MLRIFRLLTTATLVAGLAACGGGGSGSSLPTAGGSQPAPSSAPAAQSKANAQVTILIPARTSTANHRNPKYISASTLSMTIGQTSGSQTAQLAEADLTPSSPNCTAVTGGGTQCTVSFVGTAGTSNYVITAYNQIGGKGSALSTGQVQATLVAGQNTTIPLALDGVPASVSVVLGVGTLAVGTPSSTGVFVQALDASSNIIVGPGGFATSVGLAIGNDTYGTLSLSASTVTSPGQVVNLVYNGGTNVGATITPSIANVGGTAATFAGSGGSMTLANLFDPTLQTYPEDVAAIPSSPGGPAQAAVLSFGWYGGCCSTPLGTIAIINSAGAASVKYIGDTTDPFNPPSVEPTFPGYTVVHGMSQALNYEEFEAYNDLAASANGSVYYSGYFTTSSDATRCPGQSEQTGTFGILNAGAGTTTEIVLKGYASDFRIDPAGNVWFLEYSGTCNGANLLGGDQYALGELHAGTTTVTEKPFSTIGLGAVSYPGDMSITADGTTLYVADEGNGTITTLNTGSFTAGTALQLTNSTSPNAIATAPDGTTLWWSDNEPNNNYYYGFVPGSKAFNTANLSEPLFPINNFASYDLAYADGSFWAAGDNDSTGIGRLSAVSSGTPVAGYYQVPTPGAGSCCGGYPQEITSISAGNGYVWAVDDDYGDIDVLQYGAPGNGTITFAQHRAGVANAVRHAASQRTAPHHAQAKKRRR